jgi:soluble lytic murein transglycosylase-like protein
MSATRDPPGDRRTLRRAMGLARHGIAAALVACAGSGAMAQAPLPELTLDGLPRPATPPPEIGPVVPERVAGWRREALAYEHGDGLPRDPVRAAELYCRAARYGDAEAQFNLAWMLTNSRGIERDDATAAHLFAAAAEQGMPQARNMLASMGTPRGAPPPCLRQPEEEAPAAPQKLAKAPPPPPTPPIPSNAPVPIVNFVKVMAPEYRLEPALVLAFIATESNYDPFAVSPKSAQGLMQLIPDTAARFNVRNPMDPAQNIRGGMAYLRWLMAFFEGDVALVAAAYNAGERAVERYLGVPPYAETRAYVRRILAASGGPRRHPFDATVTSPSPQLPLMRSAVPPR